jgi:hypothetical protein
MPAAAAREGPISAGFGVKLEVQGGPTGFFPEVLALSKACSDAKTNRDALGQQHDAQVVAVRTAYTGYITELHKLDAIRGQIIRNNEFCAQNKCDQSLVLPVIAIPQPVIK